MSRQILCVNTSLHTFQKREHLLPPGVRKVEGEDAACVPNMSNTKTDVVSYGSGTFSCSFVISYPYENGVCFLQIKRQKLGSVAFWDAR